MKQIGQIQQALAKRGSQVTNLTSFQAQQANLVQKMWTSEANFFAKFSPSNQIRTAGIETACMSANTPCVAAVKHQWGEEFAKKWIATHLMQLNEFCGAREKMTIEQIDELALIMLAKYGYLKPQEFMIFFLKFKSGEYGKTYGTVDPMMISNAFTQFMEWRFYQLQKVEAEQVRKERDEQEKVAENLAISYNEYVRRRK